MNKQILFGLYFPIVMLFAAPLMTSNALGADDPAALALVQKIVDAVNRDDSEARRKLMHPDALACDQATKQAMAEGAYKQKQRKIPPGYRWQISEMPAGSSGWFSDKFDYPIRPTHQLQIDIETAPRRSESMMLQVVRYGKEWREVTGCPKPETIIEAKQVAKDRAKQEERIRDLAANIPPKLKDEVLRFLADGHKVDAILHYRNTTNEDLVVAKGVIVQLMQEAEGRDDMGTEPK